MCTQKQPSAILYLLGPLRSIGQTQRTSLPVSASRPSSCRRSIVPSCLAIKRPSSGKHWQLYYYKSTKGIIDIPMPERQSRVRQTQTHTHTHTCGPCGLAGILQSSSTVNSAPSNRACSWLSVPVNPNLSMGKSSSGVLIPIPLSSWTSPPLIPIEF